MQSLSTIGTEMQYWLEGVHRNTAFIHCDATFEFNVITGCCVQKKSIYCDATIEYSGHRNIVYVFTRYYAQKYSLYCSAMIEHNRFYNAILCNVFTGCYFIEYHRHRNAVFCNIITACCAQHYFNLTALIYCDEAFQYIGHRNAVFLMPSLDAVHRNTPFHVMHQFNTMETEMLYIYIHNVITGCCAKTHSIYCNATV